jgi:O-antigen ligase
MVAPMSHPMPYEDTYWTALGWIMLGVALTGAVAPLSLSGTVPLAGLLAFAFYRPVTGKWPSPDWPLTAWIAAVCALIFASSLWGAFPENSLSRAEKVAPILIFSLPLLWIARSCPAENLTKFRLFFPWIVLAMGAGILTEFALDLPVSTWLRSGVHPSGLSGLNKHLGALMLFLPIALFLSLETKRWGLAAALTGISIALMFFTESQSAMLALIVMPLAAVLLFLLPGAALPLTFGLAGFLFVFMPFLAPMAFDAFAEPLNIDGSLANAASASMRLENWDFISRKILTEPLTGFGIDATRYITDFETELRYFHTNTISHPHNMALQLWIEFGLMGVAAGLTGLALLYRRIRKITEPGTKTLAYAMFCMTMVFLMLSWSLWASWLLGLLLTVSALAILATRTSTALATS